VNGSPWRAWLAMSRFWWAHHRDHGFAWVHVDLSYGFWCGQHGQATGYTGARGADFASQLVQAAGLVARVAELERELAQRDQAEMRLRQAADRGGRQM